MLYYHFTNDMRFTNVNENLKSVANYIESNEWDHSQSLSQAKNGWYPVYTFYLGLYEGAHNVNLIQDGKINYVLGEFIKKFQFPNPKPDKKNTFRKEVENGQLNAPLRTLIQVLVYGSIYDDINRISKNDFKQYILANEDIVKNNQTIGELYLEIKEGNDSDIDFSESISVSGGDPNRFCNQLLGLIEPLDYIKIENNDIILNIDDLKNEDKVILFDILNYNEFWKPKENESLAEQKLSYMEYMQASIPLSEAYNANVSASTGENIREVKLVSNGVNKIYFGAPGTGKSYRIKKFIRENGIPEYDEKNSHKNVFRTTLHPDYDYTDLVGQVMPVVKEDATSEGTSITYEFEPKSFTQALKRAFDKDDEPIFLVLEEMSRANVAAVFGDIFQLLDRDETGESEYKINNSLIANEVFNNKSTRKIYLPSNFYVIGTVNTSDQNVYVMDTAFKRRFEFEYLDTSNYASENGKILNNYEFTLSDASKGDIAVSWINLIDKLNVFITTSQENGGLELTEDKQLGQFFIKFKQKNQNSTEAEKKKVEEYNYNQIKGKLIQYLWSDVNQVTYSDIRLFNEEINYFGQVYKRAQMKLNFFSEEFTKLLTSNSIENSTEEAGLRQEDVDGEV